MKYKNLIPSRELRLKILGLVDFIPDQIMIKLQYWIKTGRRLNLKKPIRFTEKLQWYKIFYRDPLMTQCADKYQVRQYVAYKGFEEILVPLFGVYDRVEEVNFDDLPEKFVFKTNNGSHTNILCKDKSKIDQTETKEILHNWLTKRTPRAGREWPYYNITPKIICEKYLEVENGDLIDYKFICFSGNVSYVFVNQERNSNKGMKFGIYNKNFEKTAYRRKGLRDTDTIFKKPKSFEKMIEIAEKLSENFPHVRVDLYNIDGKIYFGELTFFHGSGYIEFEPDEFDIILGDLFPINKMIF